MTVFANNISESTAAAGITFDHIVDGTAGAKVTGGSEGTVVNGMFSSNNLLYLAGNGENVAAFGSTDKSSTATFGSFIQLSTSESIIQNLQAIYNGTGHGNQEINNIRSIFDSDNGVTNELNCYFAESTPQSATGVTLSGYRSFISPARAPNGSTYNFYAEGTSPNYFAGDTLIGGTTASPNITLNSGGLGEFSSGVKVMGGNEATVENGIFEFGDILYIAGDGVNCAGFGSTTDTEVCTFGNFSQLSLTESTIRNTQVIYNGTGHGNQQITNVRSIFDSDNGVTDRLNCYLAETAAQSAAGVTLVGYRSFISPASAPNGSTYNFYAEGTSPNYFAGDTLIGGTTASPNITLTASNGNASFAGAVSKGSGSFKIPHPLPELNETHHLVHSFIEGPQADNIYRGQVNLVDGEATVNLDTAARMTEGTFVLLNTNISCFTSNETDWTAVRGSVSGNILTIEAQDNTSTATVSWMVVGERHDQHMLSTDWTDENGRVITEPEKSSQ